MISDVESLEPEQIHHLKRESDSDDEIVPKKRSSLFGSIINKLESIISDSDGDGRRSRANSKSKSRSINLFGSKLHGPELLAFDRTTTEPLNYQTEEEDLDDNKDEDKQDSDSENDGMITRAETVFMGKCSALQDCKSVSRIIQILKFYKDNEGEEETIMSYLHNYTHLLNDYHHVLDKHLNEDILSMDECNLNFKLIYNRIIQRNDLSILCDVDTCSMYKRNNAERGKDTIISQSHIMDVLDSIHCFFLHSVYYGYRFLDNNEDEKSEISNGKDLSAMKLYLEKTRENLIDVRGKQRFKNNKFVTQIMPEPDDKEQEEEEMVCIRHGFGAWYDYWNEYSEHKAKYGKLKEELTINRIHAINIAAFDKAYQKALYLLNHSCTVRKMKSASYQYGHPGYKYGVEGDIPLEITNILSVVLYTDYDTLSWHLKNTFKKSSMLESHKKLMARNSEYYNWSKTLIETVNCYGITVGKSKLNKFYHGISYNYFDSYLVKLNCPTSMTTNLNIQAIFARENGVILELKMREQHITDKNLTYFNCTVFSNFPFENERLFISPPTEYYLDIANIFDMKTNQEYKLYIHAMQKFYEISEGEYIQNVTNLDMIMIKNLCKYQCGYHDKNLPNYILQSFSKWAERKEKVIIDINYLNQIYFALNEILLENPKVNNLVSFYRINCIFKQLKEIECKNIGDCNNQYIPLLVTMLERMNELKYSELEKIYLTGIGNTYTFANNFVKFQSAICKQFWKLDKNNDDALIISRCSAQCIASKKKK